MFICVILCVTLRIVSPHHWHTPRWIFLPSVRHLPARACVCIADDRIERGGGVCMCLYVAIGNTKDQTRSRVPRCRFAVCFLVLSFITITFRARASYFNSTIISIVIARGSFYTYNTPIIHIQFMFAFSQ